MAAETQTDVESRGELGDTDVDPRRGSSIAALGFAVLGAFVIVTAARILGGEGVVEPGVGVGSRTAEFVGFDPALPHHLGPPYVALAPFAVGAIATYRGLGGSTGS